MRSDDVWFGKLLVGSDTYSGNWRFSNSLMKFLLPVFEVIGFGLSDSIIAVVNNQLTKK